MTLEAAPLRPPAVRAPGSRRRPLALAGLLTVAALAGGREARAEGEAATVGVWDPFVPPPPAAQEANAKGYRAFRAGDLARARVLYDEAVASWPEYDMARFNLVCVTARQGLLVEAARALEPLLLRSWPRFARKALGDPDLAAIRGDDAARRALEEVLARTARRYAEGLDRGLVFVARLRPAVTEAPRPGASYRLFLHQEAFHHDPVTGRYRQLTDTDGEVGAIARSPDGRRLVVVRWAKGFPDGPAIEDPRAQLLDLGSMALAPDEPAPLGRARRVELAFSPRGTALVDRFFVGDDGARAVARLALAAGGLRDAKGESAAPASERVLARVDAVLRQAPAAPAPPGAGRVARGSVVWSPERTRALYRRDVRPCDLGPRTRREAELWVYTARPSARSRLARGKALYQALFLDEQTLVYEDGLGESARLVLRRGSEEGRLASRAGAGLRGLPGIPACDE